jgi:hypothetical protein
MEGAAAAAAAGGGAAADGVGVCCKQQEKMRDSIDANFLVLSKVMQAMADPFGNGNPLQPAASCGRQCTRLQCDTM